MSAATFRIAGDGFAGPELDVDRFEQPPVVVPDESGQLGFAPTFLSYTRRANYV